MSYVCSWTVKARFAIASALLAATALARIEYTWSEAFAAPSAVGTNGLAVKTGDQHVLHFSNGVVRAHHLVTDRWFDLQAAPFKDCSAVEKLDDGRLLVIDGAREKAVYGTPRRTKAYDPVNWAVIIVYLLEIWIDNTFARVKWQVMLKGSWLVAVVAGMVNFSLFYFINSNGIVFF